MILHGWLAFCMRDLKCSITPFWGVSTPRTVFFSFLYLYNPTEPLATIAPASVICNRAHTSSTADVTDAQNCTLAFVPCLHSGRISHTSPFSLADAGESHCKLPHCFFSPAATQEFLQPSHSLLTQRKTTHPKKPQFFEFHVSACRF